MSANETLKEIINLDKKIADKKEEFDKFPPEEKDTVLIASYEAALEKLEDDSPVSLDAVRVAEMLICQQSDRAVGALGKGLGHPNPDMRMLSGDALLHIAEEGLERIMPVVEDALKNGGLMAEEMPFMLTGVDHPEVPRIIERFLDQKDPEIVASAIEALTEFGDPESIPALKKLAKDTRTICVDEDCADHEHMDCTIGQLATDALEMLAEDENV